jgi:hypothetical protein
MSIKNSRRTTVYGYPNPQSNLFPDPIIAQRAPTAQDFGDLGQEWVDQSVSPSAIYFLGSFINGTASWVNVAGGAGVFSSLTVTPGPISLTGTTTINTVGAATTTIGTGGTGAVNIGNATGNTAITGNLVVSGSINTLNGPITAQNNAVSAVGAQLGLVKSRAGGAIVSGDQIGNIVFSAFDGAGFTTGAAIISTNSGTVAAGRIASNLNFFTHPDAATAIVSRMVISPAGNVSINTPDSGAPLTIQGRQILYGAGAPAGGLALANGDLYINTAGSGIADRMFIATGPGAWTNFVTAA